MAQKCHSRRAWDDVLDQRVAMSVRNGFGSVTRAGLGKDVADVTADGVEADYQLIGNLLIAFAGSNQA